MFCPGCGDEFREGITRCPDCELDLVPQLEEEDHDTSALVSVFATHEAATLPVVRSLLDETDIPYTIKGEETLGLFPGTAMGLAIDAKARAAQVLVPRSRAEEARQFLSDLRQDAADAAAQDDD